MAVWKAADGAIDASSFRQVTRAFMRSPFVAKLMGGKDINKEKDMNP